MAKKTTYLSTLSSLEGAVTDEYNPFNHTLRTPSPSLNFVFGKGHGLPRGYSVIFYGPPGGGKSLVSNSMIGQLHQDDPDAIALKYDTEFREKAQMGKAQKAIWGIDPDRYIAYSVNQPTLIFDKIETDVNALCQEGAPIRLIVIDSLTGIQGLRELNAESIETQQIGDHAMTIQRGLKRILPVIRNHNIGLVLTAHVRAEMDMLEQKRGNSMKMAAAFGAKHQIEYNVFVEQNRNKDGRTDLNGQEFVDDSIRDLNDNGDKTAHKIRVCMKKSSMGHAGRVGEFTFSYTKGIINQYEEVFLLGANRGIIERPNNTSYVFKGQKWVGKPAMLLALKESKDMQEEVLKELRKRDEANAVDEPMVVEPGENE
jgi:RecA/RadA recombinase